MNCTTIFVNTIEKNYGHAGKKFVDMIIDLGKDRICERFNDIKKEVMELASKPLDAKQLNAVASIKLADDFNEDTKNLKEKYLNSQDEINKEALNLLNKIQYKVIKRKLKDDIRKEEE